MAGHTRVDIDPLADVHAFCLKNYHPVFLPFFLAHPPGSWINVNGILKQVAGYRYCRANERRRWGVFHYDALYVVATDGDMTPVKDHYRTL